MSFERGEAEILPLDIKRAKKFIKKHHYTGTCHNRPKAWGMTIDRELKGVIAFANPIAEDIRRNIFGDSFRGTVFGLHRLVTTDDCPKNAESWFIRKGLNCLQADSPQYWAVVSFADATIGHTGIIYQATNAIYFGTTNPVYCFIDEDGNIRPRRENNTTISKEEARERGWEITERDGKHSYLFLLPKNKRHERKLKELLKIEPRPYPSNNTKRYEEPVECETSWLGGSASETDW